MLTSHIKESPIKGLIGLGGGATGLLQTGAEADTYWWTLVGTNDYNGASGMRSKLTVDSKGDVYVGGLTGVSSSKAGTVWKFDKKGAFQFDKKFSTGTNPITHEGIDALGVDSSDNIFVFTRCFKTVDSYSGSYSANIQSISMMRCNTSLVVQDQVEFGSDGTDQGGAGQMIDNARQVVTDGTHIYVAGTLSAGVVATSSPYWIGDRYSDGGLTKINISTRAVAWQKMYDQSKGAAPDNNTVYGWTANEMLDCAVDSSGNVYVCGYDRCGSGGSESPYIAMFNSSGTLQWDYVVNHNVTSLDNKGEFRGIAVDSQGDCVVVGRAVVGAYNGIVQKYNSSGTVQWSHALGGGFPSRFNDVAIDSDDNIYTCGWSEKTTNSSKTVGDAMWITKWNSSGTLQWQRIVGIIGSAWYAYQDTGFAEIAIDSNDNIIVSGLTHGKAGTTWGPANPESSIHILTMKLPNDGSLTGEYTSATTGNLAYVAADVGASGHLLDGGTSYTNDWPLYLTSSGSTGPGIWHDGNTAVNTSNSSSWSSSDVTTDQFQQDLS